MRAELPALSPLSLSFPASPTPLLRPLPLAARFLPLQLVRFLFIDFRLPRQKKSKRWRGLCRNMRRKRRKRSRRRRRSQTSCGEEGARLGVAAGEEAHVVCLRRKARLGFWPVVYDVYALISDCVCDCVCVQLCVCVWECMLVLTLD